jgi:hypothetical protein
MKSVRIRKALPGEKPGYYNKTAKFLYGGLVKANMGMQVGPNNDPEERLKVVLGNVYSDLVNGADENFVETKLITNYGIDPMMAKEMIAIVKTQLEQSGYAEPSEEEQPQAQDQSLGGEDENSAPIALPGNEGSGTPGEDEELALSMADEETDESTLNRLNEPRAVEQEQQQEISKYGGPYTKKLKRAQQGMQQPSEEEMMRMQQGQQQPQQQQGGGDQMQQIMQQVGQALQQGGRPEEIITQLLQGQIPPEAIMQIFVELGMSQEQVGQIIQSVIQQSQGGQEQMMQYGGYFDDGGEAEDFYNSYESTLSPEDMVVNQYVNPGQLSDQEMFAQDLDSMILQTPGTTPYDKSRFAPLDMYLQDYQGVADGSIPDDLLPMSQGMYGGALDQYANGGPGGPGKRKRKKAAATTTETNKTEPTTPKITENLNPTVVREAQQSVLNPNFIERVQNAYYTQNPLSNRSWMGAGVEALGQGINYLTTWTKKGKEKVAPSTTSTLPLVDIMNLIKNPEYEPQVLKKNTDGTYNSGLAFNIGPELSEAILNVGTSYGFGKSKKPIELALPASKIPELNFLSLHTKDNNTRIKLEKDASGFIKASIVTDVKTKLKGYDKDAVVIKDEFYIDPQNKQILDVSTGMPLEQIKKSYYTGNQLNWYNQPFAFPFTKKYPNLKLEKYPTVISEEPLKKDPMSLARIYWNTLGRGSLMTPFYPFIYPGFAARSKFYPNADKVTADFLGRQREIGPEQVPGGMTFGDQPFGAQYADYQLLKDRNFRTGRNFLGTAGFLTGAGLIGYNLYQDPGDNVMRDKSMIQNRTPSADTTWNKFGAGRSFDTLGFGIDIPLRRENKYDDSMYVSPSGDTIHDKGYGRMFGDLPGQKHGGAHKKKFIKRVQQMFEPGGEAQDTSLGKGSRMDDGQVSKRYSNFISTLKQQSDKRATEDLYKLVQESGDPQLMNIFIGDNKQEQPQDNQMMQQPQFGEMGGYVNMDVENPLTRFIYGGDEDYYESNNPLPEAKNGNFPKYGFFTPEDIKKLNEKYKPQVPYMNYEEWLDDYTSPDNWPGAYETNDPTPYDPRLPEDQQMMHQFSSDPQEEQDYNDWIQDFLISANDVNRFKLYNQYLESRDIPQDDPNQNLNLNTNTTNECGPGTIWNAQLNRCVPVASIRYNPRLVRSAPGLLNTLGLWNGRSMDERVLRAYGLNTGMPYMGDLTALGKPVAKFKKNWFSPTLRIYDPNKSYGKEELQTIIDSYYGGRRGRKSTSENKSNDSDKKQERKEKKKSGPKEVKFSSAAMKYRLNQGFDQAFGAPIDYYKSLGKKIIKPFTKKK